MHIPKELLDGLLMEAKADEIDLSFIASHMRYDLGLTDSRAIKEATLACIERLLETGEVVGAEPTGGLETEPWQLDTAGTLDRISREWDKLGREPHLYEIAVLTGKGGPE